MNSSPIYSGNISHASLSEVSVTVMEQPTEASQPTEVTEHPPASSIEQLPHLTLDIPPHMTLAEASAITQ